MNGHTMYLLFFGCLAYQGSGARFKYSKLVDSTSVGCWEKTCGTCLTKTPFVSGGSYCKWCPLRYWQGKTKDVKNDAEGVCKPANQDDGDCERWSLPGVTPFTQKEPAPLADVDDALVFCGVGDTSNAAPALGRKLNRETANSLTSMEINDPAGLRQVLDQISTEICRLNRFSFTNPVLFNMQFVDNSIKKKVGLYSWKLVVYGINFIPVAGNAVSLGLSALTDVAETALVGSQGRSQDKLISLGRDADSQYFGDVNFGLIYDAYMEILGMTSPEVRELVDEKLKSIIASGTGAAADAYSEFNGRTDVKVGKFVGHAGLFVGGFFTFGATWIAGAAWTGADIAASMSATAVQVAALKSKTQLLLALARLQDESVWDEAADRCDITSWFTGENPCPDGGSLVEDGKPVPRVCVRTSPWGHHKSKIDRGLFSPEGRCFPTNEHLLSEGLPCLTHDSCRSSYCHFETRMQYIFSDHPRRYARRALLSKLEGEGVPITDQLHSMQVQEEMLPDEETITSNFSSVQPLKNFVGEYNSFEGIKYATSGTCAKTCPKKKIGKGECAGLTLRDTASNVHKEKTSAVDYDFGIVLQNRIMMGYGQQGYALVGQGPCANNDGHIAIADTRYLKETGRKGERECASICWEHGCEAFNFYHVDDKWMCNIYDSTPTKVIPETEGDNFGSKCYRALLHWPLDMYQPWNSAWYMYQADISRMITLLSNEDRDSGGQFGGSVLSAVRAAYAGFCSNTGAPDQCPDPEDWGHPEAINALTVMAPLSATQLRELRKAVDPSDELLYSGSDKVQLRDLFADVEWGEAWQRFLGYLNVEEVAKEDPKYRATFKAEFAQKLQNIAVGSNLRMADGVWDLERAQAEYLKGQGA